MFEVSRKSMRYYMTIATKSNNKPTPREPTDPRLRPSTKKGLVVVILTDSTLVMYLIGGLAP